MTAAFASALHELPLILFTTFASIGAGAFIALAGAFLTTKFTDDQLRRIDRFTLIPVAVVVAGFVAAFFHLGNPAAALNVFAGVGTSPLSNELFVAIPFALVMVAYIILALARKLGEWARKGLAIVVGAVGLTFAAFMGLAYNISTVPVWASPWPVLQMIGFALIGGAALGAFVLALANVLNKAVAGTFRGVLLGLAVIGGSFALVGFDTLVANATMMGNAMLSGADLVVQAAPFIVVGNVGLIVAFATLFLAGRGRRPRLYSTLSVACAAIAILAARATFYALQISVGL